MIFNIEILNILIWLLLGFILGGVLPFIAAFLAPVAQLDTDVTSQRFSFSRDGLKSVFHKYYLTVLLTCLGALIGGFLYRIIAGPVFVNYSTDGFFYSLLGALWLFLAFTFGCCENPSKKSK